jgi:TatD DNase family protein
MIEECLPADRGTVVLQWLTGSVSDVRRGVQIGFFFSVNEQMLSSPNGRRVLGAIPDDRLLTETDGPFVERSGQPVGPGDVEPTLHEIAKVRGIRARVVQTKIVENLRSVLGKHASGGRS